MSTFRYLTRLADIVSDVDVDNDDRNGLYESHDREVEDHLSRIRTVTTKMTRKVVTGARSNATTTYAEPATDTCRVAFTKKYPDTVIVARIHVTCFQSVAGTAQSVTWGVGDGTTVSDAAFFFFNAINTHHTVSGEVHLTTLAKGPYTFSLQWKSGTGVTNDLDTNDTLELSITEMLGN